MGLSCRRVEIKSSSLVPAEVLSSKVALGDHQLFTQIWTLSAETFGAQFMISAAPIDPVSSAESPPLCS